MNEIESNGALTTVYTMALHSNNAINIIFQTQAL